MQNLPEKYRNNNGYPVPEGYFEQLPEQVMQHIAEDEAIEGILAQHKNTPLEVPEHYFDQLPTAVMDRIAKGAADGCEAEEILPHHNSESDFPVPEGYFEELPNQVMARIEAEKASRFIVRRRFIRIASAAASAAVFIGVAFFFAHSVKNTGDAIHTAPVVAKSTSTPAPEKVVDAQTADFSDMVAQNDLPAENVKAQPTHRTPKTDADEPVYTDPATDQFISEHLGTEDMDDMDYDILDFYSDDMAVSDMWGW